MDSGAGRAMSLWSGLGFAVLSVISFHAAFYFPILAWLAVGYLACLFQLTRFNSTRKSFYLGLIVGVACAAPQLDCFWRIFGPPAIVLWLILGFWIAAFTGLASAIRLRFGALWGGLLTPLVWTGFAYFRSELYYLRFSWFNRGYAL
jgi:hypothetical protein